MKIARNAIFDAKKGDVDQGTNIPGTRVSVGSYSAFVPAPLPPQLRRHGESLTQLLPRLDRAIDQALTLGSFTDGINL